MKKVPQALTLLGAALLALSLSSCVVNTPQMRIDNNQSLYESLPKKHQELVSQGRIDKGMSKSAVFLALGDPSRKTQGHKDDTSFERWDYTRLEPRYYHSFHGFYGPHYGCGPYGPYGHHHSFFPSHAVEYVPVRAASVIFRKDVVDSWERLSPGHFRHRYSW